MSRADDLLNNLQRAVGDKPFVLLAGAGDLVSEKLRELPEVVSRMAGREPRFSDAGRGRTGRRRVSRQPETG